MKLKRLAALTAAALICVSITAYAETEETKNPDTFTIEKSGDVENPERAEELFEQEITRANDIFKLDSVDVTVRKKKPVVTERVTTKTETFPMYKENGEAFDVEKDTETKPGYTLVGVETQSVSTPASEQEVTATQEYADMSEDALPKSMKAKYTDPATGETYTGEIPLVDYEVLDEAWVEGKNIDLIFNDYSAKTYVINGKSYKNTGKPDISGNENFIISAARLNPEKTRITGVSWNGEPYTSNGRSYRKAAVKIEKLQKHIVGHYKGMIEVPASEGTRQVATYNYKEKVVSPDQFLYEVDAVGTYVKAGEVAEETEAAAAPVPEEGDSGEGGGIVKVILLCGALVALLGGGSFFIMKKKAQRENYLGKKYR